MPRIAYLFFFFLALALIIVGLEQGTPDQQASTAEGKSAPLPDMQEPVADRADAPAGTPADPLEYLSLVTKKQLRDFDAMREHREIRALVTHSKTFYFFDGAVQRGLSYEALTAFEKFINRELNTRTLKVRVVFIPVTRDQLLPALEAGYGDLVVANMTITPERSRSVDFSRPVLRDVKEVLVTGPASKPITSMTELAGSRLHLRLSSSYAESVKGFNEQLLAQGLAPIKIVPADEHLEDEDLLEMVNAGLIDAIVMDQHKASFWEGIFGNISVHDDIVFRSGGDIGWAMRKNNPEFRDVVDKYLRKHGEGTLLGNILLKRYLEDNSYIHNNLRSPELKKFNATAHLFQKYAAQYDFDWLMVMSQAYQESRLDQSARSHNGAVGIMQMLPSTASDKNVNIPNINNVENNIHAGNKYLRFLRDRYFEDQDMTDLDKTLFSFAAYNAGPARIAQLRREAKRQGLDPNIWFDNVEVIAARRIGRETVQYVSNIYKYWVAYRLSRDTLRESLASASAS